MGLSKPAFFLAKNIVELPRLAVLVLMLLATFYPMANPRCPFDVYFIMSFSAAFAISGWAYILSIAQDPKTAQLSMVVIMVVFTMFCGVIPRLSAIDKMGPGAQVVAWLSFARWYVECLYIEETRRMSDAWRMPPPFYRRPASESALMGLAAFDYTENSTYCNCMILVRLTPTSFPRSRYPLNASR